MQENFIRNIGALTEEQSDILSTKTVAIVGAGGLGGRVSELVVRMGIGNIILIDYDEFSVSNINRQLFCNSENLGQKKVDVISAELIKINQELMIETHSQMLTNDNAKQLLIGADIVVDALDNIEARLIVEETCDVLGIPLIHGAVNEWQAQVAVVYPKSRLMHKLYGKHKNTKRPPISVLSSVCSLTASLQATLVLEVLLYGKSKLDNKINLIDLRNFTMDVF